jgi:parallel beta-helix repeat protein
VKLSSLLLITFMVPFSYGATKVVSNAGVILGCPAQYTKIQAAVNAASPGDTVFVCNTGIPFNEQVTISKAIKLVGQTGATIEPSSMVANTTSLTNLGPIASAVLVTATTGVTISDLIVDGSQNQITSCSPTLIGVYFQNASGTLAHSAVRYFALSPSLQGCPSGLGVYAETDGGGGIATVIVDTNSVHDFQKNGITANETGATLTAEGNVVTGWGPTPENAQNGIQIGFGATGTLAGNTVSNLIYSPCTSPSNCSSTATGILIYEASAGVVTKGNNVTNTQGAVYYLSSSNGTISGNTFSNTFVFDGIGVDTDGTNPGTGNTVTANTIVNSSESGIYIDTAGNFVTDNKIVETPIGIWFVTPGSSQSGNSFYATPVTVENGVPPAQVGHQARKPQPVH